MPVKPNLFERTAVYTLNAVPGPIFDLAGLFACSVVASSVNVIVATPRGGAI
jgi:hypothetical protein